MDKKQREERRRQEDIALQRGLLWVVGAIVLEVLLVFVNRYYINYRIDDTEIAISEALSNILRTLCLAAPIAAAAALVWTVLQLKKGERFALPLVLTLACAAVAVCAHVAVKFQGAGVSMLFWLVVAWGVLALVYYIYQREFFLGACACGMSVLALWFIHYGPAGRPEAILLLAAIVVVAAASLWLKKQDGVIPLKETVQFLPKGASYAVPLATCLASLAAVIIALLAGETAAFYLLYVMVAWLFALFVYYTVKLM